MKAPLLFVMLWLSSVANVWAQTNCYPIRRSAPFYANAIKTSIGSQSDLFYGLGDGFVYPAFKDGGYLHIPDLIYRQQFWIGGRDESGKWKNSYMLSAIQDRDFVNGPGSIDPSDCVNWGHVWVVNGYEVASLKDDYKDGIIDSSPGYSLLVWPGRGNPYIHSLMGIQLPDQQLAPFYDLNLDGIYDPWTGDYPIIGEDCPNLIPTQMAWTIYNDVLGTREYFKGQPLGVEVGVTVFALDFPSPDDILQESVFVRYDIQNISGEQLSDVRIGHFVDAEIGCSQDDLVGCYPNGQTFYAYNDGADNLICPQGVPGYGDFPPVLTTTFLSDSLNSFIYWNRVNPWDPSDTIPIPQVIENVFHGLWQDGTTITEGGNGYMTSGNPTTFLFSGLPSDSTSWAQNNTDFEFGDRRLFGVAKAFGLISNERKVHYSVYSAHRGNDFEPPLQVDYALSRIPFLHSFYGSCFTLSIGNPLPCLTDCVWPGDMDGNGMCNNLDLLEWGISLDRMGVKRTQPFIGWLPQHGLSWGKTGKLDSDARHQDANGDGTIDPLDLFALNENFGRTVNESIDWGGVTLTGPEIKLTRIFNPLTSPDELLAPGKKFMIQFDVSDWPVDSIYNLGYSITFDPAVVSLDPGFNYIPKSSFFVDSSEVFVRSSEGRVNVGITRADHVNLDFTPFELGKLRFTIKQDAPQEQYPDTTEIVIQNVKAYLADGTLLDIGSNTVRVPFGLATGLDLEKDRLPEFVISPNPTNGLVSWSSTMPLKRLNLYSIQGKQVHQWNLGGEFTFGEILIEQPAGLYLLIGYDRNGLSYRLDVVKL